MVRPSRPTSSTNRAPTPTHPLTTPADKSRAGRADHGYDVICLDTDNGPNWLVFESNAGIYDAGGLDLAAAALAPGGVLAVWSASRDPAFEARLRDRFRAVE